MIWVAGRIVADEALAVNVLDRTFEHGLGLFETFRTWGGRAPLLDRHLARMRRSAEALGVPLGSVVMPDAAAVAALVEAEGMGGDLLVRVTLTGGLGPAAGATLWMRAAPLPPPTRPGGAVVGLGQWRVLDDDPLARHKALNYWSRRLAYESARSAGLDEVLSTTPEGVVWEGSRTNVFLVRGGTLTTPCLDGPLVPGVMRGLVCELAGALPLTVVETGDLRQKDLTEADELFLTNSVRGIVPVSRLVVSGPAGAARDWDAPGPWTRRLLRLAADRLASPGGAPP